MTEAPDNATLLAENARLEAENASSRAGLEVLRRLLIRRRSERFVPAGDEQLDLFAERDEGAVAEAPAAPRPGSGARAKHPGRAPLPEHFPLVVEVVTPEATDGEAVPVDGSDAEAEAALRREGLVLVGYDTSERVEYRPGQYVRVVQKRPRYLDPATGAITVAHARRRVLARSIAGETLAVDVILRKYLDHVPIYRQCAALRRDHGWALSRATVGKWVERVAKTLRPLYDALAREVLAGTYVQMDESRIAVLSSDKPGATHTGQMWLVRSPETGAVVMRYDRTRAAKVPAAILAGFSGTLQTDGYGAYGKALKALRATGAEIAQVGCLAHVRRKFYDAREADGRADEALRLIGAIYALESRWRGLPPEGRLAERRALLTPAAEAFTAWLSGNARAAVPKTPLGKAIAYARSQWPSVAAAALRDGRVEVDNNGIENCVRPLALGRKNYLFAGNHGAAQDAAVLYSLLLSCRAAGVNARDYLNDTLERILDHPVNRIAELLPSRYAANLQDVRS